MSDYYLTYFYATCIRRLELSLDLSGWDTAAVTDMTYLFNGTSNLLTSIDMRNATFAQSIGVYGSMFTNNNLGLTMTVKDADAQALINSLNPHPNAVVIATPQV